MSKDYNRLRLEEAARLAARDRDGRSYFVGAVGLRRDGARVAARNGHARFPEPAAHAEARLCQKLDVGATVWVARMTSGGRWALAKPCPHCEVTLRRRGVARVVYTTGPDSYEVVSL